VLRPQGRDDVSGARAPVEAAEDRALDLQGVISSCLAVY
jgi:hypothetical protein